MRAPRDQFRGSHLDRAVKKQGQWYDRVDVLVQSVSTEGNFAFGVATLDELPVEIYITAKGLARYNSKRQWWNRTGETGLPKVGDVICAKIRDESTPERHPFTAFWEIKGK